MSLGLEALAPCFQGIIPALFFTCAKDGTPNVAYLSHVDYVDATHVALSFQFFNKSRRNIAENPHALVHVTNPDTQQGWSLRLKFVRSETDGAVFERMALRIEAIASYSGLKGIFKLLAADIYEVTAVAPIAQEPGHPECGASDRRTGADAVFTMKALQDVSQRINQASCLDDLLDSILASIEESFGFSHSMILLAGEQPGVLVTIATRGYGGTGVGAEARFGLGIAGLVAEAQKPIRISGLLRGMLYAYAVKQRAEQAGLCPAHTTIEMPGLQNPASQLGVPLLVRGELVGVLCIESERQYRFHEEDKTSIELLGSYLAIAIQHMQMQESAESVTEPAAAGPGRVATEPAARSQQAQHEVTFYRADETILVDGDYLIRGLPAKILWKVLTLHAAEGRREFTNRELRLDKSLNLPGYKDNLETRLLLLRRRLDQKLPGLRLVPSGRGRFALELSADVRLVEKE